MMTFAIATKDEGLTAPSIAGWINGLKGSIVYDGDNQLEVVKVIQVQTLPVKPGLASAIAIVEVIAFK